MTSFVTARNCQFTVAQQVGKSPTPHYEWAAEKMAIRDLQSDPARPIRGQEFSSSCLPPADADRLTWTERNGLARDGASTYTVTPDGRCVVEVTNTTYKTNSLGIADKSYKKLTKVLTTRMIRWDLHQFFASKYPDWKL